MRTLITILIGLLVVGCGKNKQTTTEDPTPTTNTNKADGITEKPAEKLTAKEVTEVMAWEIGTWEVKVLLLDPDAENYQLLPPVEGVR